MDSDIFRFGSLNVAIEGCCHGELDMIYDTIRDCESHGAKVDILICCGDFQCVRNKGDLECVAMPSKYRTLNSFHEYVYGIKTAPVPTIFVGGNHEASNILQSLYFGGYVAPNIYYLGSAGVVWFKGLRIAGVSGIYNERHYRMGRFEKAPYSDDTLRSVYHLRELEVYRLSHFFSSNQRIDVFLSHDWPQGVWDYGDRARLLQQKRFLADDMQSGKLGSPPLMHLLQLLKPSFWFSSHLHTKFAALVPHAAPKSTSSTGFHSASSSTEASASFEKHEEIESLESYNPATRFLALDKVLPGRLMQKISF